MSIARNRKRIRSQQFDKRITRLFPLCKRHQPLIDGSIAADSTAAMAAPAQIPTPPQLTPSKPTARESANAPETHIDSISVSEEPSPLAQPRPPQQRPAPKRPAATAVALARCRG